MLNNICIMYKKRPFEGLDVPRLGWFERVHLLFSIRWRDLILVKRDEN
jgi:hypothetical protein